MAKVFHQVNRLSLPLQAETTDDQLVSVFCTKVCMQLQQSGLLPDRRH